MSAVVIEAVAHYQRVGDGAATIWAAERLLQCAEAGEILRDWRVLGEWQAGWVQVLLFTYRFALTSPRTERIQPDVAATLALNLAESIVGERDVQVLGVKVVEE